MAGLTHGLTDFYGAEVGIDYLPKFHRALPVCDPTQQTIQLLVQYIKLMVRAVWEHQSMIRLLHPY